MRHRRWHAASVALVAWALVAVAACSAASPGASEPRKAGAQPAAFAATGTARAHGSASPANSSPAAISGPIVALGDSYTAGDMLPLDLTASPLGCLRSTRSYPVLVARAMRDTRGLTDVACNGAGWKAMTAAEHTSTKDNPPQLSVLTTGTRLVMLTLGGDDLGFMNTLKQCMKLSWTKPWGSPCRQHFTADGADQLAALVTAEGPRITTALTQIHAKAPNAKVILVGYPDMFPQRGSCWPVVPITAGDVAYLRGAEVKLNAALRASAGATGTTFIDVYTPSIGHDFCADGDTRYVEGLVPGSLTAPFHLNARGHSAVATLILKALGD